MGEPAGRQPAALCRACLGYLRGASLLLRREALEQVGLLDDGYFMYWEDVDLSHRLRRAGGHLVVHEEATVMHNGSASLGKRSPAYDACFNASAVHFFRLHARVPGWPILVGVALRLMARVLRCEWRRAATIRRSLR